ncbi:MAG: GntR family transcriptional regulator [Planctomycetota bacterium]|nr:GntR family transcriptional regulator [Planctomycetota bacterium]
MLEAGPSELRTKLQTRRRTRRRQSHLAEEIRRQIVSAAWPPGHRLPTQAELVERFGVSGVTVQRAIAEMAGDGFIETRGRQGTFVVDRPPHLWKFALVFPAVAAEEHSRFAQALVAQADRLGAEGGPRFRVYRVHPRENDEAHAELLHDIARQRLAGLVIINTFELAGSPLVDDGAFTSPIPRVAVVSKPWPAGVPCVFPDLHGWVRRAMQELASRGVKSAAAILTPSMHIACGAVLRQAARARRIAMPERWIQITPHVPAEAPRNAVLQLMHGPRTQRPASLLILDDNLVESASAGLVEAGVHRAEDLAIIAHSNFPCPAPSVLPMRRLGFDARKTLQTCLDILEARRVGSAAPVMTLVPPEFEDERPAANTSRQG